MGLLEGQAQVVAVIQLLGDPEPMNVTLGVDGAVTPNTTTTAVQTMFEEFEANILPNLGGAYTLLRVLWQQATAGGVIEVASSNDPAPFALGGTVLPSNCAVLIHKHTAGAGRGRSGRMFWPGVPESAADAGGVLSEAYFGDMASGVSDLYTSWNAGDELPGLYLNHGPTKDPGSDPPTYTPPVELQTSITGFSLDPVIATQRRRMRH